MASHSRLGAAMALALLCCGFAARSGCFVSSGPSLRGLGSSGGLAGRSAAWGSLGGQPLPSLPSGLPRASISGASGSEGWFGGAGLLGAVFCVASAALYRGKRRQQSRGVAVYAAQAYTRIYGEEDEIKCPDWINPQSEKFGVIDKTKFDVPAWLNEAKWRAFKSDGMKSRHINWYRQFFDNDGKPAFRGKRRHYTDQAVDLLMGFYERNPIPSNRTVEVNMNFWLDQKFPDQQIRTSIKLPHGTGKELRVAVFCTPDEEQEALDLGACSAGQSLAADIEAGNIDFDVLIAKPQMMPRLAKLGRILGPRKLMPSPKSGTVVTEYKAAIEDFSKGSTLEVRTATDGGIRVPVAQISMGKQKIVENVRALFQGLVDKAPPGAKYNYWKSVSIKLSKSPCLKINRKELARPVRKDEDSDED